MEIYKMENNYVIGVNGGRFYTLKSDPEAIISTIRPIPSKKWVVPKIKDRSLSEGDEWTVETEFREFLCDENEKKVYIIQFNYSRYAPGYISGYAEFFVTEEYAKEKLYSLRKTKIIREYVWDVTVPTWKEVHHKKYYRKT